MPPLHSLYTGLAHNPGGPVSGPPRPLCTSPHPQQASHASYGLIREESRFNARARSSTGALGLAQLMPATARQVAESLDLPPVGSQELLQPVQNIRLGAAYLGQFLKRFGGNPAYAVAAYNAEPGAAERWRHALPQAEFDRRVEHIAYGA